MRVPAFSSMAEQARERESYQPWAAREQERSGLWLLLLGASQRVHAHSQQAAQGLFPHELPPADKRVRINVLATGCGVV
jgi:hypothetical protein